MTNPECNPREITMRLGHQLLTTVTIPRTVGPHCGYLAPMRKSEWLPIVTVLAPVPLLAIFAAIPATREWTICLMRENWGNIASVWGLGASIGALFFAKGARRAAEDAKRDIRRRNRADELHDAHAKTLEIGTCLREARWDIVFLRAQEVSAACGVMLARGRGGHAQQQSQVALALAQASSIERFAMNTKLVKPTPEQILTAAAAQRRLRDLLGAELGNALAIAEGGTNEHGS